MVTRKLLIDGTNGRVSITNLSNPSAITDPQNNLSAVYFHTDLAYLQLKETLGPTDITLPTVARAYYYWDDGGGGCGGGCYITTACVDVMGLSDDCTEMKTLRWFRDNYMMATAERCMMVADYYFKAPEIVGKLKALPDSAEFFKYVFHEYIETAVSFVQRREYEKAMDVYKQGVQCCCDKAGVEIGKC